MSDAPARWLTFDGMGCRGRRLAGMLGLSLVIASTALAQPPARPGPRLLVTVVDQTGGVLPGATVTVAGQEDATRQVALTALTSGEGVATFDEIPTGRYLMQVELAGFLTAVMRDVQVGTNETRRLVTLQVQFTEEVDVGRDRQSDALDPAGPAFTTVLTREMIDALPDDPDEMEAVLLSMAPPGATIFVDGFAGGAMPPKELIRTIRVPRMDNMAAQYHGIGDALRIEIQTRPGVGPLRGRANTIFHDDALSAQNPFIPEKGEERTTQGGVSASGTLIPDLVSFSINASGTSRFVSPNLLVVLPDGSTQARALRRPTESSALGLRVDYAFRPDHSLRISVDRRESETRNLGMGGFNLEERGYRATNDVKVLRLAESGPVGQRMYTDSRLELAWSSARSQANVERPTTRVIGAFTGGGAQVTGGQESFTLDAATDLDIIQGLHAWRVGLRVQGGRFTSDDTTNYLGTYTFASLDDFNAGRPSTYTRRIGDPRIRYSAWQTGIYLQDDWRIARSALISVGLRAGFQTLADDQLNLSPRFTLGWAPFGDGGLTMRASYGYLYDWVPGALFKQAQLVDGFRLQELNVASPSYPDPPAVGTISATNRYLWSDDLHLPATHRVVLGVEKQLTSAQQVSGSYTYGRGLSLLRGRNLNPPSDGVRPDPSFANVVELVSDAGARSHAVTLGWNLTKLEWRRLIVVTTYTWTRSDTNTTGGYALPANGDALDTEWGAMAPTHRGSATVNLRLFDHGTGSGMGANLNLQTASGTPYNITTGRDDNRDGLFSDRPVGVSRNSARTDPTFSLNGTLNYAWRFGPPRIAPNGTVQQIPRYVIGLGLNVTNLTNHDNFTGYSGVMTSPFFGQPTNVSNPRRLQMTLRFDF